MPATKIATCCYCGTRAALVLRGRERHELSCATCGAPLHDMKMLRRDHPVDGGVVKPSPVRAGAPRPEARESRYDPRRRKKKRRKGLGQRIFEEAWDVLEDIFD